MVAVTIEQPFHCTRSCSNIRSQAGFAQNNTSLKTPSTYNCSSIKCRLIFNIRLQNSYSYPRPVRGITSRSLPNGCNLHGDDDPATSKSTSTSGGVCGNYGFDGSDDSVGKIMNASLVLGEDSVKKIKYAWHLRTDITFKTEEKGTFSLLVERLLNMHPYMISDVIFGAVMFAFENLMRYLMFLRPKIMKMVPMITAWIRRFFPSRTLSILYVGLLAITKTIYEVLYWGRVEAFGEDEWYAIQTKLSILGWVTFALSLIATGIVFHETFLAMILLDFAALDPYSFAIDAALFFTCSMVGFHIMTKVVTSVIRDRQIPWLQMLSKLASNKDKTKVTVDESHATIENIPLQVENLNNIAGIEMAIEGIIRRVTNCHLKPYFHWSRVKRPMKISYAMSPQEKERSYVELTVGFHIKEKNKNKVVSSVYEILAQSCVMIKIFKGVVLDKRQM